MDIITVGLIALAAILLLSGKRDAETVMASEVTKAEKTGLSIWIVLCAVAAILILATMVGGGAVVSVIDSTGDGLYRTAAGIDQYRQQQFGDPYAPYRGQP